MIPPGVSYRHIAKEFQAGVSIHELTDRYGCEWEDVEHAIREVLKRQQRAEER